ncbi:MAG TPA: alpha/beta fold hydrolase [Steroidobacteraceae bacterium]|nr:alpha/beta fold hydrolase [Steroidobacteraceae bacterium]
MPAAAPFEPPRGLRNPHLQSILASLAPRRHFVARRARAVLAASRDIVVDCGDGVRLLGHHSPQPEPARNLVLLLHGWEGSAESLYVLSCAALLYERGFDVFRLNLRDHGPTHHLNPELFHSCRIAEVVGAVRAVQARFPAQPLSLVGYSLGGNFALRVAVRAPAAGIRLKQVVAVCPVLDPVHTLECLEHGSWIYRNYFVLKWRNSLVKKRRAWPDLYDLDELLADRNLTSMTERLVLRYSGFPDLMTYLTGYAIVGEVLAPLAVRARIIASLDDPIIPASDLARLAKSAALSITTTARGGHCGFIDGLRRESWADRQVLAILSAA